MSQEAKSHLNLAGEFLVAGELHRRQVSASITYGASKRADIFALDKPRGRIARIEVKTTNKARWPVGGRALLEASQAPGVFWVLVRLPDPNTAPEYFIFSGREIVEITKATHEGYLERYRTKHGVAYSGAEIPTLGPKDVAAHKDRWETIVEYLQ